MERLSLIINKLKKRHEEGGSYSELLLLLDEIRTELNKAMAVSDNTYASVSVWVPAGYADSKKSFSEKSFLEGPAEIISLETLPERYGNPIIPKANNAVPVVTQPQFSFDLPEQTLQESTLSVSVKGDILIGNDNSSISSVKLQNSSNTEFNGQLSEGLIDSQNTDYQLNNSSNSDEIPEVFELNLFETTGIEQIDAKYKAPVIIEQPANHPVAADSTKAGTRPKELHEILASKVNNQNDAEPVLKKALGETLGGGKISDLRKAIAINDRFRFINALFRGDETLFERAVKTINNFNILPEAQYWIQRELAIKFGWNDEDELVQHFYTLVSRRFL